MIRDATMLKVAYAWALRRREVSRLELNDWGRNPRAPEFRDAGALQILALDLPDLDLAARRAVIVSKGGAIEYVYGATGTARLLPRLLGPVLPTLASGAKW